ncbi:MAG: NADAR family protein [Candidatus Protochlamydia sp.]|nr:NADAR family protein [Candidatus Protochlamydia sp.]
MSPNCLAFKKNDCNFLNQEVCIYFRSNLSLSVPSKSYALNLFKIYPFNEAQKGRIYQTLQMSEKYPTQKSKYAIRISLIIEKLIKSYPFVEDSNFELANAYPCRIEFRGKQYHCAEAAFQAQKYIDQPKIMDLFTFSNAQQSIDLAKDNPMTAEREITWRNQTFNADQNHVLWDILKAKFEQNPAVKEKLLETGSSYLICRPSELYFNEGFDGLALNLVGYSLMRLRKEYSLLNRCGLNLNALLYDIIDKIFNICLNQGDANTIGALALLNKHYNASITPVNKMRPEEIFKVCPLMKVADVKMIGIGLYPSQILRYYREMVPHVEGNAGVMLLSLKQGFNPLLFLFTAYSNGVKIIDETYGELEKLGSISLSKRTVVMLPLGIFKNSKNKTYTEQNDEVLRPLGCEMVTLAAALNLWFFTYKLSAGKSWLFDNANQNTFIRTSLLMREDEYDGEYSEHICFGDNALGTLNFFGYPNIFSSFDCGAIGMRTLDTF